MKEKLIIRNFGPIKNVELELGRFNVLIGEQATGKSTVAKVLAVCRYFSYITGEYFIRKNGDSKFKDGLEEWGLGEFVQSDSFIFFECINYQLTVTSQLEDFQLSTGSVDDNNVDNTLDGLSFTAPILTSTLISISPKFKQLVDELKKIINPIVHKSVFGTQKENPKIPASFYQNDVVDVLDNPFYIPAERGLQSIFSLGKSSIQNISDSLFSYFADIDSISREFTKDTKIEPLSITYKNENGRHFIKSDKHDFLSLSNAASGYQSTIPIVLLIKYYSEIRRKNKTFIIEEPELNLFPSAQNELIKFMADKTLNYGNSIFLNTHSPYILTSLNNLMYAFQIGQEHKEEVNEIVNQKYWVNPEEVSAYMMLPNGECKSILDKEGLIKTQSIDGISADLNKDFNAIMDIEIGILK